MEHWFTALAGASLLFAATAAYLQLNRLWQRKHLSEVAESISLAGIVVKMFPLTFYAMYFLSKGDVVGIIDSTIWLIAAIVIALVGAGFWVPERRGQGVWQLVRGSIRRESQEVAFLARDIFQTSSRMQLLDVLTAMALVDGDLHQREIELIQPFVDEWGLDVDWSLVRQAATTDRSRRLLNARDAVTRYLQTSPSEKQAGHLRDVLTLLIDADDSRAEEEALAFEEVDGMLGDFLDGGESSDHHAVVIAPQNDAQAEAIATLLQGVKEQQHAGGRGYAVGRFHSATYAEIICRQYRELGFFTVVIAD